MNSGAPLCSQEARRQALVRLDRSGDPPQRYPPIKTPPCFPNHPDARRSPQVFPSASTSNVDSKVDHHNRVTGLCCGLFFEERYIGMIPLIAPIIASGPRQARLATHSRVALAYAHTLVAANLEQGFFNNSLQEHYLRLMPKHIRAYMFFCFKHLPKKI